MSGDGNYNSWPSGAIYWYEPNTVNVSIPFTWNLPSVRARLKHRDMFNDNAIVGGPATELMPDYFNDLPFVVVGKRSRGVLQRINPLATRTTTGCPNRCSFCAVPKTEGEFVELDEWPDLPVICDNNLLAASDSHLGRVWDRLEKHNWCDFNQGLDARLLNEEHAARIGRLRGAIVRLALDHANNIEEWITAFELLRKHGTAKHRIRSYVLCGYRSDPTDAWNRCEVVESRGAKALPQWYHPLDALKFNAVLRCHNDYGWSEKERLRIMGYYYKHRGEKPQEAIQ